MNLQLWVLVVCSLLQKGSTLDLNALNPINVLNNTVANIEESINLPNVNTALEILKNININLTNYGLFKNVKTFAEIANEAGLQVSEYEVTTNDGYILTLFHIESNGTSPVLLIHGFIDSADTFIIRRNSSLAKTLVDAGYDVWLMNVRGNKYSRKHVSKNPDTDKDYWDYSFHEMGTEDLPTVIDFVLSQSNEESLCLIGHSQGFQMTMVLGSEKPEYNDKVKLAIGLAPVCFLQNIFQSSVQILVELAPVLALILEILGIKELIPNKGVIRTIEQLICPIDDIGYALCVDGIVNSAVGADNDQLEKRFFEEDIMLQSPVSTSVKNALHFVQLNTQKRFQNYDEGIVKNIQKYLSPTPPEYDLNKVVMKVITFEGKNDKLSTMKDTDILSAKLPNLVKRIIIDRPEMNHLDFVWGKDAYNYLYPEVLQVMQDTN